MNTTICNKTQTLLLEATENHANLPDECQKHLDECAECQAFAKTLALFLPPSIPTELETETLRLAKAALPAKRIARRHAWRRWALCAATLAVLCSLAVFMTLQHEKPVVIPAPVAPISANTSDSVAEWDDMSFATDYAQTDEDLSLMDLELDLLLSELD